MGLAHSLVSAHGCLQESAVCPFNFDYDLRLLAREMPIVRNKVPYNTLAARSPRECPGMPVHALPIPFGLLQCMHATLKGNTPSLRS